MQWGTETSGHRPVREMATWVSLLESSPVSPIQVRRLPALAHSNIILKMLSWVSFEILARGQSVPFLSSWPCLHLHYPLTGISHSGTLYTHFNHARDRYQTTRDSSNAQNPVKLFKLAHLKLANPASLIPSLKKHSEGLCPHSVLSLSALWLILVPPLSGLASHIVFSPESWE